MNEKKNPSVLLGKNEIGMYLDMLKDSPIVNSAHYHRCLADLCGAVKSLSRDAGYTLDLIEEAAAAGTLPAGLRFVDDLRGRFCQLMTLSDILREKVMSNDYILLDDLFFYYRKHVQTSR